MDETPFEVFLPFPSDVVRTVFSMMQHLHETGRVPTMLFDEIAPILSCVLYLGCDKILDAFAPLIGENLNSLDPALIAQFPLSFRPALWT
jgi:hypothetical protein